MEIETERFTLNRFSYDETEQKKVPLCAVHANNIIDSIKRKRKQKWNTTIDYKNCMLNC